MNDSITNRWIWRAVAALVCTLCLLALTGCGDDPTLGPPVINPGRDLCAECGMIINEPRFAAALTVEVDGAQERRLFDDIGDMIDYERSQPDLKVVARYVHAFEGERWILADEASYLISDAVATPMASGILAFTDGAAAEAGRARHHGKVLSLAQVRELRPASRPK